jgi:hypothetical protein
MKAGSRPQYYRIRRMVQMVRESAETGYLPNSSDFMKEFEVSRRNTWQRYIYAQASRKVQRDVYWTHVSQFLYRTAVNLL